MEGFSRKLVGLIDDGDEALDIALVDGAAEGARDEGAHDLAGICRCCSAILFRWRTIDENHAVAFGILRLGAVQRPLQDEALQREVESFLTVGWDSLRLQRDSDLARPLAKFRGCGEVDAAALVPAEGCAFQFLPVCRDFQERFLSGRFGGTLNRVLQGELVFPGPFHRYFEFELRGVRKRDPGRWDGRVLEIIGREVDARHLRRRIVRQGETYDLLGDGDVFLHQQWGDGEDVAVVVEAVSGVIWGECLGGVVHDAKEVIDGVSVFVAIQAAYRHASRIRVIGIELENGALDPGQQFLLIRGVWLRLVGWRHDLGAEVSPYREPVLRVAEVGVEIREGIHTEIALVGAVAVAVKAILYEQRLNLALVAVGSPRGCCDQGERCKNRNYIQKAIPSWLRQLGSGTAVWQPGMRCPEMESPQLGGATSLHGGKLVE